MRRPTLNSPRNNRTAHGSDPSMATCLLFSRLLSSTPKSKLSKQQQQQWRTTRRPKNHRRRRRRRWGASRTTPSAPSRPSSTSPASSPTPSSPSFSTMYSSPDCLLFFFFLCVSLWSCGFDASGARGGMQIYQAPAPKWKSLKNRRLQNWGACYSLLWSLIPRLEEPLFFPFPFALQWARFWVFDWIRFVGFCRRSGAWEGAPAAGMWVYSNQSLQILAQLCGLSSVIRQDIAWLKWYEFRGFVLCD